MILKDPFLDCISDMHKELAAAAELATAEGNEACWGVWALYLVVASV